MKRQLLAIALAAALVFSAGPAAAASNPGLDFESDKVPNPRIETTVTKAAHNLSADILDYEDDNGNAQTLNASIADVDNPVRLRPDKIDWSRAWPSSSNSTLAPDGYAVSGANASALNVSAATGDVDGVRFQADMSSGDTATANFSNVSVTSDVTKRIAWIAANARTLNGTVAVQFHDTDGDYVELTLDSSQSTGDDDVVVGDNTSVAVAQQQLSDLAIAGSGDGTLSAVESIEVVATDGNVDVTFHQLTLGRLSKVNYGTHAADIDSDGSNELVDNYEPVGQYNVTGLDTLSSAFSGGMLYDVEYDAVLSSETVGDVRYEFDEDAAEEYDRQYIFKMWSRISLPNVEDLEFSGSEALDTVAFPTGRLVDAWYVEGAGDQEFGDLAASDAQIDLVSDYESAGDNSTVVVDESIQEGTTYVFAQAWTTDQDDKDAMQVSGGGVGGLIGGPVSWFDKWILNPISGALAIFLSLFGLNRKDSLWATE